MNLRKQLDPDDLLGQLDRSQAYHDRRILTTWRQIEAAGGTMDALAPQTRTRLLQALARERQRKGTRKE